MLKISLICFILLIFAFLQFDNMYTNTYTSAVCDKNICRDYLFTCGDSEIIESVPISGFVVFSDDWVDEREKKNLC